jgi:CHRD domain-containing protein
MRRILLVIALVAGLVATANGVAKTDSDPGEAVSATTFSLDLTGPGGTGSGFVALNPGGKVCYVFEIELTEGDVPQEPGAGVGNAHIHVAPSGGIAVDLDSSFTSLGDGMFVATDCVRADKATVRAILANPEQYYVNIHTADWPMGAVSDFLA